MKRIVKYIYGMAAAAGICLAAGCDKTSVNETVSAAPVVASFTPASAPVGAEIVVTGEHLSGVYKAFIGDKEMTIVEKVSDSRLTIRAGAGGRDGKIVLQNSVGRGESEAAFTYTYAVPELTEALLPESVAMNDNVLLAGSNLTAVEAVIFTAPGHEGHEGEIVEQRASELVVRVPYVESDAVEITLRYFDGTASVVTEKASPITVVRIVPEFDPVTVSGRTNVGQSVTLTGRNLDKVGRILVGGFEATCTKQAESLTFVVPAGDFADGQTQTTLAAEYFDGNETQTLSEAFVVYVPLVLYWENISTWCQSRLSTELTTFFSPATGVAYANERWRTDIDPVSYNSTAPVSAGQMPLVGQEEYESVNPYFFFSTTSSSWPQINSPANTNGQLNNIFFSPDGKPADNYRVTGGTKKFGTPVMTFVYLDPAKYSDLIKQVVDGTLETIDEKNFRIDPTAATIGGIDVSEASGSLDSETWAKGLLGKQNGKFPTADAMNVRVDAVLLMLYHDYRGAYMDLQTKAKRFDNVKRIGLMHIVLVDYQNETLASGKYGTKSRINFNCYWQKYDYDYTKLQ